MFVIATRNLDGVQMVFSDEPCKSHQMKLAIQVKRSLSIHGAHVCVCGCVCVCVCWYVWMYVCVRVCMLVFIVCVCSVDM